MPCRGATLIRCVGFDTLLWLSALGCMVAFCRRRFITKVDGMKLLLIPDHIPDIDAVLVALGEDVVPMVYCYTASARGFHKDIVFKLSKYKRCQFEMIAWMVFPDKDGMMAYKKASCEDQDYDNFAFQIIMDVLQLYVNPESFLHMVIKRGNRVFGDKVYFTEEGGEWILKGVCTDVQHLFNAQHVVA